jgi:transcriptional regulator EpsA
MATLACGHEDKDRLIEVIHRSLSIRKHIDFFRWLQEDVRHWLPHELLVAAWGDFGAGCLSFDVSSRLPGIRTQTVVGDCDISPLMRDIHRRWLDRGERWLEISGFDDLSGLDGTSPHACMADLRRTGSLMAHGIRDRRGRHDCLYVFFGGGVRLGLDHAFLELLLPFIDGALRRVEHLESVIPAGSVAGMSKREREIMTWLITGKTNEEIGLILGISPNTVKNHLKRVYQKLDVFSRTQAVSKFALLTQASR